MKPPPLVSDTRSARAALILLILVLGAVFLGLLLTGRLEAVKVADTRSYMDASRSTSLKAALSHHRTIGFPMLIRFLYSAGTSPQAIPTLGISTYFLGVLLFFFGVRQYARSTLMAFAAAVPLPFAGVMTLVSLLQPDFLSAAFVLVSISSLLLVISNTQNWAAWIGIALGVPMAYQFRPAAQFLVLLIPILASIFLWLRCGSPLSRVLRVASITACVTMTPFLLFCALRVVTVGNFGLVSFGGSNLAASVVNFLDTDLVRKVPADSRSLAKKILKKRRIRGWEPMRLDSDPVEHFRQGSDNLFRIARDAAKQESRAAARQEGAQPTDPEININVDVDRRLTRLAIQIIRLRTGLYVNWIRHSSIYGLSQLRNYPWIVVPFILLTFSLPIAWLRRPAPPEVPADSQATFAGSRAASLSTLIVLALGYFTAYLLLVSCTFFPFDRYFVSLTLFIPSALVAGLLEIWRRVLALKL